MAALLKLLPPVAAELVVALDGAAEVLSLTLYSALTDLDADAVAAVPRENAANI